MKLIQAHIRQECVGKDQKGSPWERLLPLLGNPNRQDTDRLFYRMPSGSLLSETYRGRSLNKQKFERGYKYFTDRQKSGLRNILTRDIGLPVSLVGVLLTRPVVHYKRIEEFISGFVDSLWLADETVFCFGSSEVKLIRKLIRKIFAIGTHNLCDLVDQWKEWGNNLFHTLAETDTIGPIQRPKENNIFRRLNSIPYINRVYHGDKSMLLMQHVSHLVSSRQMPYMGLQTEIKSQEKFKDVLSSDFKPSEELVFKLKMAARRIGGICRSIRTRLNPGESHVSVTSSGEYDHPISKGGQAAAVRDAMIRILTRVPEEDQEEDTPFGPAVHRSGIPLWRTIFREVPLLSQGEFLEHYSIISQWEIREQSGRYLGLDEVTGIQMMYVAWKEISPTPVLRAEVVPEMGNKARYVTLSDYWLNVLQAPLSHLLIDSMKYHPSVFSSFHRQDQAFEAVKGLCLMKSKILGPDEAILSSDLKDATNAQQWSITKAILHGYIEGFGLSSRPQYINLVMDLIGPRLVLFKDNTSVLSRVGIMMGEAIAKPSLTLLNLAIEELTFLQHCHAEERLYDNLPAPHRDWRFIHIGGDDHLVRGPSAYLKALTQIHLDAGSHIDPGKHGLSRICVKYTERLVNILNLQYGQAFNSSDYSLSVIVDSVKVRLLERGQSTELKKDNKNVAIGKSTQLGGCLEWLPKDDRFWTLDKKASIRALFVERMGSLLPRKAVNPRAFAAIHLPTKVGGYGLGLKEELRNFYLQSPKPTQGLINKSWLGLNVKSSLRYFRKLNCNVSARGVGYIQELQELIIDRLSEFPIGINAIEWREVKNRFPNPLNNARRTIADAADKGILSIEEFAKRAVRGTLFQDLLAGGGDRKIFNTRKFTDTYKNIVWKSAEDDGILSYAGDFGLTSDQIAIAIDQMQPQYYFDVNQIVLSDMDFFMDEDTMDFTEERFIDLFTKGLPSLMVNPRKLGIRIDRPEIPSELRRL
nr:MAG: putative RNA-dependent RNA polymerase [Narnaviridae sp.]